MFIKWRHEGPYKGYMRWYAYLTESKRINGKPRQKIITYLASIEQRESDNKWIRVDTFWYEVTRSLCLAGVDPGEYSRTMRDIGKHVPLQTYRQWEASIIREYEEYYGRKKRRRQKKQAADKHLNQLALSQLLTVRSFSRWKLRIISYSKIDIRCKP